MAGKYALVIGNSEYQDSRLAGLVKPGQDARGLAEVLRSPAIGAFDEVRLLVDEPEAVVRRAISRFFAQRSRHDLLLLYFSGHGVLDDEGQLYFAVRDTEHDALSATAVAASFVRQEMNRSPSRRQVLILDCCNSGSFGKGAKGPGDLAGAAAAFEVSGYGRAVLTATDSIQYAWENDQLIGNAEHSVFTHFLIEGLQTGAADNEGDADGQTALDELFHYARTRIRAASVRQTPTLSIDKLTDPLILARNPHPPKPQPAELPAELRQLIESPLSSAREAAVRELARLLLGSQAGLAEAARETLVRLADDDSRRVSASATEALQLPARLRESLERTRASHERQAQAEATAREDAERQAKARAEAEREEAERQAKLKAERAEAERQAQAEAAARAEAERLAKQKAEREEAERQAAVKAEAERQAQAEAAARAEAERLAKAKADAEAAARAEAERQAKAQAEATAREEAERLAQAEAAARTVPAKRRPEAGPRAGAPAPHSTGVPIPALRAWAIAHWRRLALISVGWGLAFFSSEITFWTLYSNGQEVDLSLAAELLVLGLIGGGVTWRAISAPQGAAPPLLVIGGWVLAALVGAWLYPILIERNGLDEGIALGQSLIGAAGGLATGVILYRGRLLSRDRALLSGAGWAIGAAIAAGVRLTFTNLLGDDLPAGIINALTALGASWEAANTVMPWINALVRGATGALAGAIGGGVMLRQLDGAGGEAPRGIDGARRQAEVERQAPTAPALTPMTARSFIVTTALGWSAAWGAQGLIFGYASYGGLGFEGWAQTVAVCWLVASVLGGAALALAMRRAGLAGPAGAGWKLIGAWLAAWFAGWILHISLGYQRIVIGAEIDWSVNFALSVTLAGALGGLGTALVRGARGRRQLLTGAAVWAGAWAAAGVVSAMLGPTMESLYALIKSALSDFDSAKAIASTVMYGGWAIIDGAVAGLVGGWLMLRTAPASSPPARP